MTKDNWLSTDEAIAEVCDDAIKKYGGTKILSIRCPDKEIEAKVRKYLDSKRGGKTIDTYVGGINDSVKATRYEGDDTPVEEPRDDGDDTPDLDQIVDDKHAAQMADLTPAEEDVEDVTGLVDDDPDIGGLV